jgi:single-strand DNA-binding protein
MNFNRIILLGRIGKEPEMKMTQTGKSMVKFSLAVQRDNFDKTKEKQTDWFNCTAFGSIADFVNNYLGKGRLILIEGKMQVDDYTDKQGAKKTYYSVIVNSLKPCDKKNANGNNEFSNVQDYPKETTELPYTEEEIVTNTDEDGIPF